MDEKEIVTRLKRGETEYFAEIVNKYKRVVFNHSYSFLRSKEEAEDAAQEIFISVFRNIKKFRGDSSIGTWIYRITVNTCKNKLKQLQRLRKPIMEELPESIDGERESLVDRLEDKEEYRPDNSFSGNAVRANIMKRIGELPELFYRVQRYQYECYQLKV